MRLVTSAATPVVWTMDYDPGFQPSLSFLIRYLGQRSGVSPGYEAAPLALTEGVSSDGPLTSDLCPLSSGFRPPLSGL